MAIQDHPEQTALAKIDELLRAIHELVRLEEQSQEALKQPAERLLDNLAENLDRLEERKTKWMRSIERASVELLECRRGHAGAALEEAHGRLLLALRGLQRIHQDNERVLNLRLTLLSEDLRQVERSRRFLRTTLQSVAA